MSDEQEKRRLAWVVQSETWQWMPFSDSQPKEKPMSFMDWVRENHANQPSLGGQFDGWLRQGAKDAYNNLVPAFPDSARSQDEPGTPLNPTPQMVTQDLGQSSYESVLETYAQRGREVEPQKEQEIER